MAMPIAGAEVPLPLRVVHWDSEDVLHPARELELSAATRGVFASTSGWVSGQYCSCPQELGFALQDGCAEAITKLRFVAHESSIARRLEVWFGYAPVNISQSSVSHWTHSMLQPLIPSRVPFVIFWGGAGRRASCRRSAPIARWKTWPANT